MSLNLRYRVRGCRKSITMGRAEETEMGWMIGVMVEEMTLARLQYGHRVALPLTGMLHTSCIIVIFSRNAKRACSSLYICVKIPILETPRTIQV
ncbi:hypothetical protein C8Q73DRAFT_502430 [Cubamyces lactineus]|nr:hypothetical protein C8Q73DRAFT_502430 [Cubamyces lactineus]